ncbi:flagellar hook-length control protein FliK [Alteromonas ponticola]|uniref:Flagellar hook-length control protein FliK n=1 Tax=Alteromonas aquimaris TaxID=2998417 RepID=A0ABT3P4H8_9ALTE|nr:flagellar hook-length control protein FliK [Alteromonas aquimaris]MCW8107627.1 flagellar hook-length control protein FliK [Alteromonas aquimaris]
MQQVATKGSQIAALPIDLEVQSSPLVNTNDQFRQALEQTANRHSDKNKKGEITPVWKAPERTPASSPADRHVAKRTEPSNAQVNSPQRHEPKAAGPAKTEQQNDTSPAVNDKKQDTDWLGLVESVKDYNDNPDKAALANVAESISGDEVTLSDELAAKIDTLLAKLSEDSAITPNEMSILAAIQEQLGSMETDGDSPISVLALYDNIAEKLNTMLAKSTESGQPADASKTTALASAMLILQSAQADIQETTKLSLGNQEAIVPADDLEEAAKLLVSLLQSEKQKPGTHPNSVNPSLNEKLVLPQGVEKLLQNMQQLSDQGKADSVEAIADRVLALLPPSASEQQQKMVKNAVIAGLNEMNAQLGQGREPGISLQDMISGALSEASIQLDNAMKQQLEGQLALLSNAMQTAQQQTAVEVDRQALASIDTSLRENAQIRSEMTKAQQAADGIDKPVNVQRAEGQQQLSEKIRWMINSRSSLAEIRLDPPELGSMQVRVNISGDTANVNFVVQSQHAKDTLAQAENRLREMLAEQGITLGESFVQQQNSQQGNGDEQFAGGNSSGEASDGDENLAQPDSGITKRDTDGIDDYA